MTTPCKHSALSLLLAALGLLLAVPAQAQLWDRMTNPEVTVSIQHPPGLGVRATKIAFMPVDNRSSCADQFLDMIVSDFVASGVEVLDRQHMRQILGEQDFQQSGYVDPKSQARLNKLLGSATLAFVKISRCAVEQQKFQENYKSKSGYHTQYTSRSTFYLKGTVQVVDLATGRTTAAVPVETTMPKDNRSFDQCCPVFPSEFEVQDAALRNAVVSVHRMFFPWTENRALVFFDDQQCNLKTAQRMLKAGDTAQAHLISVENAHNCMVGGKVKQKHVWHANYNVGMTHAILGQHEQALGYFNQALKLGGGEIVAEAVATSRKAIQLSGEVAAAEARTAAGVQHSNSGSARGASSGGASPAPHGNSPAPAGGGDLKAKLAQLKEMYDGGLISKTEYEAKKQELLKAL